MRKTNPNPVGKLILEMSYDQALARDKSEKEGSFRTYARYGERERQAVFLAGSMAALRTYLLDMPEGSELAARTIRTLANLERQRQRLGIQVRESVEEKFTAIVSAA